MGTQAGSGGVWGHAPPVENLMPKYAIFGTFSLLA